MLSFLRSTKPRTAPRQDPLLFLHLPKTAGTALRASLRGAFRRHERVFIYDPHELRGAIERPDFEQLTPEQRARFRLVMGHFFYGLHEAMPAEARYATMLREPVDRIVSLYYHYRNNPRPSKDSRAATLHQLTKSSLMSLEEWAFEHHVVQVDNGMVRMLMGSHVPFGRCTAAMLDEALEHMEHHFDAVLIHARMEESLDVLTQVIGRAMRYPRRRNVTRTRPPTSEVDPTVARRLLELNQYDAELYRAAEVRFECDLARLSQVP